MQEEANIELRVAIGLLGVELNGDSWDYTGVSRLSINYNNLESVETYDVVALWLVSPDSIGLRDAIDHMVGNK